MAGDEWQGGGTKSKAGGINKDQEKEQVDRVAGRKQNSSGSLSL